MKKIVLITSATLLILCIFIACDNGVAFVNDIKPLQTSSDGESIVPIYVTALDRDKFEGDQDPELTYIYSPNPLPDGVYFTGVLARDPGETEGGSPYAITQGTLKLEGTNASKQILIFTGAKFTIYQKDVITIRAKNMSKFKGDNDPVFDESTYVVSPSIEALERRGLSLDVILYRDQGDDIGPYPIHVDYNLTGERASEYVVNSIGATFYISAEDEIIVTAPNLEKSYKDADPVFRVSTTPALPAGLTVIGGPSRKKGEVVGEYTIDQGSLAFYPAGPDDGGHKTGKVGDKTYKLIFEKGSLKINKKPVAVTAESYVVLKDDPMPVKFAYRNSENLPDNAFTGELTCEANDTHTTGEYAITQGSLDMSEKSDENGKYKDNYYIPSSFFFDGVLNVTNNIPIAVYANAQTQVYGEDEKFLSYSYTPALPKGLSLVGELARSGDNNVGTYAINQGALHLEGPEANLYVLHFHGANYTITKKPVKVIVSSRQEKYYGEADNPNNEIASKFSFSTNPELDTSQAFEGQLTRDEGENVKYDGGGEIIGYDIKMRDDADKLRLKEGSIYERNYAFDPANQIGSFEGSTFKIKPCPVVITPFHQSKVRDDIDPEFTFANSQDLPQDAFTGSLTRSKVRIEGGDSAEGEAEGTYNITLGTLQLSEEEDANGKYKDNYIIQTPIQKAQLHITPPGPVNISDPVGHMAPIIKYFHDKYEPIKFGLAAGPPNPDDENIPWEDPNDPVLKDIKYLGSFKFWYNSNDRTVYYYYGGPVNLYGDCHNLFERCTKFQTMDMRGFNTDNVTNMYQMFFHCENVTLLDLSGWSFDNVTNVAHMFDRCEKLKKIKYSTDGVNMSKVIYMNWMFAHNFYMTPDDLSKIIDQWIVRNDKGIINPRFTSKDYYYNTLVDKLRDSEPEGPPSIQGANRIISPDMVSKGSSNPSYAFRNNSEYTTKDGVKLYLGNPNYGVDNAHKARSQRLNIAPAADRDKPEYNE